MPRNNIENENKKEKLLDSDSTFGILLFICLILLIINIIGHIIFR